MLGAKLGLLQEQQVQVLLIAVLSLQLQPVTI